MRLSVQVNFVISNWHYVSHFKSVINFKHFKLATEAYKYVYQLHTIGILLIDHNRLKLTYVHCTELSKYTASHKRYVSITVQTEH